MKMTLMRAVVVIALVLLSSYPALASGIFIDVSAPTMLISGASLNGTSFGLAFDGSSYWSAAGGHANTTNLAQYSSGGILLHTYTTSLDFRSIFTDADGNVLAKEYHEYQDSDGDVDYASMIYRMNGAGAFAPFQYIPNQDLVLGGPGTQIQSGVVMNTAHTEYVSLAGDDPSHNNYRVDRWDLSGNWLGNVFLSGFGGSGEDSYPQDRGIATGGGYYLTYNDGLLSAWDITGARVGQATLTGAGDSLDSNASLSYVNGLVWINDRDPNDLLNPGGVWRGYDVGLGGGASTPSPVPEPSSILLLGGGLLALAGMRRRLRS